MKKTQSGDISPISIHSPLPFYKVIREILHGESIHYNLRPEVGSKYGNFLKNYPYIRKDL